MRFRSVRFEPFGALRGVELDFGAAPGRLHLVWGPNEAGKSTALRGIVGFLFGIDHRTADQHERGVELRVRARIEVDDGRVLDLVRRKGTKDPLRDGPSDAGVPERELSRWLGGIDEATFRQLHALDHAGLRAGGDSIVRGQGRLGELMVEATTGTTGFVERLQALREEANALYRPRAKTSELAVAVDAWKSASSAMKQESLAPNAWLEQERGVAATRQRVAEADQKLKESRAELMRLEKLVALEDPLARLRHRRARRAALGEVRDVPEGTAARQGDLANELAAALEEIERAETDIARLGAELGATSRRASSVSAAFDRARALELRATIDGLARAIAGGEAELGEIEHARGEALEALDAPPDGTWTERVVDARALARLQACAAERREARHAATAAERALADADRRLAALDAEPEQPDDEDDLGALVGAIAAARRASLTADGLDVLAARRVEVARRGASALAQTGAASLSDLAARVPDDAIVEEERRRRAEALAEIVSIARDASGASERLARASNQLAALRAGTPPPSEDELAAARAARDAAMERAFEAVEPATPEALRRALRAAEREQRRADGLADRLRHEAARVEQVTALEVELRQAAAAERELNERAETRRAESAAEERRFSAAWPALQGVPLDRARSWLAARAEALASAEEQLALTTRADELRSELAEAAGHLALLGFGDASATSRGSIDAAVAEAEARLDDRRLAARRREERRASGARATHERAAAAEALGIAQAAEARAAAAWRDALSPHRLGASMSDDDAVATLVALAAATRETRKHERIAARVAKQQADRAAAEEAWGDLLRAASLDGLPVEEVLARSESAREARAELPRLEDAIAQRRDVATRATARADRIRARLDEIVERAGVPVERLVSAEERATEARGLAREIATLEATLVEMTGARDLAAAEASVADVDFSRAAEDAEQLLRDVESLEASRARDLRDVGAQQVELDEMERGRGNAADLAETAESHLARARDLARRAAVARAAVALLEAEIERHRTEREGPVLRRAGELFRTLTAGRWSGLRVGEDETGALEIRCVGERELGVGELSEGTVDQLYLALRLAALEHHAAAGVALPLVLDDVLQNSDDERTAAALRALADVVPVVQVILFTHETQVVEIARRVLPSDRLAVHQLGRDEPRADA